MKKVIKGNNPVFPFRIEGIHYQTGKPVSIYVIGGVIGEVKEIQSLPDKSKNLFVAPGLIDNQVNGFANIDFSGSDLTAEGVIAATKAIHASGTTTFLPTLITNSHENLLKNFRILAEAFGIDEGLKESIPGFHLEGPYISPLEGFRGTHNLKYIRKPSWREFSEYREASGGRIIQVTVAPEVEGAMEFIARCREEGIVVALGHSNANSTDIRLAVQNGARLSTHLGNGCANMIHRHNNPIWPQLAEEKLMPSIIADGNHLLPEEVKVFIKVKGVDNLILTSDVIYLSGMAPGNYEFGGMKVTLHENGMLLNTAENVLAGASFPLSKGVGNVTEFAGVSLADAFRMAVENPARIYGLKDKGTLEPGKRADIILFEKEGRDLKIKKTYKNGIPFT